MWWSRTSRDLFSSKTVATIKVVYSAVAPQHCSLSTVQHAVKHKNSTVDDAEVEKHSKMSEEWWSRNGPMKALHAMNEIRIPFIRDGILGQSTVKCPTPLTGQKILDVGCGGGILSEPLSRLGAQVTGVDASPELIELAKSHAKLDPKLLENNLTYINTTIEEHATQCKEHYDAVVASEIIEHVTDKDLFIKSCLETLKPGGAIFFTTPNRTQLGWLGGIIIAENVLGILPKGTHEWNKFTTPTELSFMLERRSEDLLRYMTVKPNASIYCVRQKLWHLLDLPDYCDESIVLRASNGNELPLTELRKGNKPEQPFVLEVWGLQDCKTYPDVQSKMLTFCTSEDKPVCEITTAENSQVFNTDPGHRTEKFQCECQSGIKEDQTEICENIHSTLSSISRTSKLRELGIDVRGQGNIMEEYNMRSELSCKVSTSSLRFNLPGRKNRDNFTNMLLKIQNELSVLHTKIGLIETKISR